MDAKDMIDMPEQDFRRAVVERFNAQGDAIQENTDLTKRIAEDTAFMRTAWAEGLATIRFFCRVASAWRFLLRQVIVPVGLPGVFIYALWYYAHFGTVPGVIADIYKLIKILL